MKDPLIPGYIPRVLDSHCKIATDIQNLSLPFSFSEEAGILNTDICSFTKITERVSAKGHYGVEIMINILNSYFGVMLSCIEAYGGSLLKFGGDAMFAIFPGIKEEVIPRMIACQEEMYLALGNLNLEFDKNYGIEINFDGAINWGKIRFNLVGDPAYHLDYYVDGKAILDLFDLGSAAPDGEIVFSETIQAFTHVKKEQQKQSLPAPEMLLGNYFLPSTVQRKLKEKGFTAELRNTAVIFLKLSAKDGADYIDYRDYHDYYCEIQRNVYSLDGTINKIDFNDKGYLVLITFGTPYNHVDDIERAVTCAYRIQKIHTEKISIKIGITYSNIFAGILGSPSRHEYGIIGNAVNLAARLMSNSHPGEISFSEDILINVSSRFESIFIEETHVKGIKEPLRIYKIVKELPGSWYSMQQKYQDKLLVAYREEVQSAIDAFEGGGQWCIVLSGAGGSGKSFVAYYILNVLKRWGKEIDLYAMEEFNQNSQCDWLLKLLNHKLTMDDPVRDFYLLRDYLTKSGLSFDPELILRYFLAIRESSIDLKEEEFELVYENLSELVCSLESDTDVIFVDDIQWLDASSYQIYVRSLPKLVKKGISLIIGSRNETNLPSILSAKDTLIQLQLHNLSYGEAKALIENEIPVISIDALKMIINMTNSNPLFTIEMCNVIKKNIDVENSILAESDLKRLEKEGIISDTIENLLLHEYENLDEDSQKMLKVASIIGKAFALDEIDIVSKDNIKTEYIEIISHLNESNIIGKKAFDPGVEYVFNNYLMRDAIYRTILLGEKKNLHEKIGSFYANKFAENLHPYYELIANHFIFAGNRNQAVKFCMLAGEKTARLAAYAESNYYFEQALSFCRDATNCYRIVVSMIKNCVNQGDAIKASEYFTKIDSSYFNYIEDEYYFQKTRMLLLRGSYHELADYAPTILEKINKENYKANIMLRYMDALQYLNELEKYEQIAKELKLAIAESGDLKLSGDFLTSQALFYASRSDYKNASIFYRELRSLAEKTGDMIHLRLAFSGMGNMASRTGNKEEAKKYMLLALAICEKMGDRNGYSKLILDLGTLFRNEGDHAKAIEYYTKSLQTAEIIGNLNQQGTALYNIGEVHYYQEEYEVALDYFHRSLHISETSGDKISSTFCYDAIGDINFQQGNYDIALDIYSKNLETQKVLQDKEGIAHSLGNLGNIAKMKQDYPKAEEYYAQQVEILSEVGDVDGCGRAWFNWAMIEVEQDNREKARERLLEARKLFAQCNAQMFIEIADEQLKNLEETDEKQ